jgi:uncharacterized damage-inducible protein DinB
MADEPFSTLLEEALEAWEDVRRGLLEEAGVLPDEAWGWRPSDEARSVSELLRHVLESGLMAVGELAREDGDFTRRPFPELVAEHAAELPREMDPPQLRERLRLAFAEGAATLRARGELHMLQRIRRFDGLRGTRLAWFQHHVAHEMYHRGQLALYVRLLGKIPALTQRIHGE